MLRWSMIRRDEPVGTSENDQLTRTPISQEFKKYLRSSKNISGVQKTTNVLVLDLLEAKEPLWVLNCCKNEEAKQTEVCSNLIKLQYQ